MKNVLVYGLGRSGVSAARLLLKEGYRVFLYDKNKNAPSEELAAKGAIPLDDLLDDLIGKLSFAVISPGVSVYDGDILRLKEKTSVIGEAELGFSRCGGITAAITGTNGKTTTCCLIDHILKTVGKGSFLLGNIGTPLSSKASEIKSDEVCVAEISSFQLETVKTFKPKVAALINITPDHLDRHGDFQNYINTKFKIFQNQTEDDFAVLNADDKNILRHADTVRAKKIWFSLSGSSDGACVKDGFIFCFGESVADLSKTHLVGSHNVQNMLCAVCVCKLLGVDNGKIAEGLYTFKAVRHRLEKIGSIDGVDFINDSKATNVASVLPALSAFQNVSLILGGSDKGCEFDELFADMPDNIKYCVLTGQTQNKLAEAAHRQKFTRFFFANDFVSAVKIAYHSVQPDGTVLLSPACASFDCFENYIQRGEEFERIFLRLKNEREHR